MYIDKKYGVPKEEISCPGCGLKYSHHNTLVDTISQECSKCCEYRDNETNFISGTSYIEEILGYRPLN
jgi:hypothetical protein